jgi:hypothetical protein
MEEIRRRDLPTSPLAILPVVDQDEQDIIRLGTLVRPTNDTIEVPIKAGPSEVANVRSSAPIPRHQHLRQAADRLDHGRDVGG